MDVSQQYDQQDEALGYMPITNPPPMLWGKQYHAPIKMQAALVMPKIKGVRKLNYLSSKSKHNLYKTNKLRLF